MNIVRILKDITALKAVGIIIAVGFLVYGNTLVNEMLWDDYDLIINNEYIRDWKYFPKYFSENLVAGSGIMSNYWRPLLLISFFIDYKVGGLEPFVYHLQNMSWHILSSVLFFVLLRRLSLSISVSLLSSLLFLVHPVQTEAITYISGRSDPMHMTFIFAGLICFVKSIENKLNKKYYFLSIVLFILALLTRERSVAFALVIMWYVFTLYGGIDIWKGYCSGSSTRSKFCSKKNLVIFKYKILMSSVFAAISLGYFSLRMTIISFDSEYLISESEQNDWSLQGSIVLYIKAIAIYSKLIFWPANLYVSRVINAPENIFNIELIVGVLVMVLFVWIAVRAIKSGDNLVLFLLGWIGITFLPTLYTFPMHGVLAEHWLYQVFFGIFTMIARYISLPLNLIRNKYILGLALILIIFGLISLSIRTVVRNTDWREPKEFFEKNISLGGKSILIYMNLGMEYERDGDYDKAFTMYEKVIKKNEDIFWGWYNMGNLYRQTNNNVKALEMYRESISRRPDFLSAYKNSAVIYMKEEKRDEAITIIKEFIDKYPENIEALFCVAGIYHQEGDLKNAYEYIERVLKIDPDNKLAKELVKNGG